MAGKLVSSASMPITYNLYIVWKCAKNLFVVRSRRYCFSKSIVFCLHLLTSNEFSSFSLCYNNQLNSLCYNNQLDFLIETLLQYEEQLDKIRADNLADMLLDSLLIYGKFWKKLKVIWLSLSVRQRQQLIRQFRKTFISPCTPWYNLTSWIQN